MSVDAQRMPGQADTVAVPRRLHLAPNLQIRRVGDGFTERTIRPLGARIVNGYAELDRNDGAYWVYKRPGIDSNAVAFPSVNRPYGKGLYVFAGTDAVYSVFGDQPDGHIPPGAVDLYKNTTHLATLVVTGGPYFFESVPAAPNAVVIAGNTHTAYVIDTLTDTVSVIADADFPGQFVRGFAYLDGTLYVMDRKGNIQGSDIDDPTSWDPLNVIKASSSPDRGIALTKHLSYIVAMKQNVTQVFYNAGNPVGSPLSPIPDAQIDYGCLVDTSIKSIDNTLLWVTSSQSGGPQVIRLDSLAPRIVSTPDVERLIEAAQPLAVGGVYAWALKISGHKLYGLSFSLDGFTLVYDLDQDLWYLWSDVNDNWWPIVATEGTVPAAVLPNQILVQHQSNGKIYRLSSTATNDYGNVFATDIYTPNYDAGVDRKKHLNFMRFQTDQVKGSRLKVRWSADDYETFSNFREVDLSVERPILDRCGTFKRRAYHLRHDKDTRFRIKAVDLQLDLGTL